MLKNPKVTPRALTAKEKADRANDIYDSFANYLCFCPGCNYEGVKCPNCGRCGWILGYPLGSTTGFVKF